MKFDKKDKIITAEIIIIIVLVLVIFGIVILKGDNVDQEKVIAKEVYDLNGVECTSDETYFCIKNLDNDSHNIKMQSRIDCHYNLNGEEVCTESINDIIIDNMSIHTFAASGLLPGVETEEDAIPILKEDTENIKVYILLDTYAVIERKWDQIWRYATLDIYDIKMSEHVYSISNGGIIYKGEDFTEEEYYNYEITDNTVTYYMKSDKQIEENSEWELYLDKIKLTLSDSSTPLKKEIVGTSRASLVSGPK